MQPEDAGTDGVSLSFTCTASRGTNFLVTVLPPLGPNLQATPSPVVFPNTYIGTAASNILVTVTNNGTADATGVSSGNSNPGEFPISGSTCGATIAKGASCTFSVGFTPFNTGLRTSSITLSPSSGSGGLTLLARGTGTTQRTVPAAVDLGSATVGTTGSSKDAVVTNTGTTSVTVSSVTSSNVAEFPITTTCATLAPGATCTVTTTFKPNGTGTRNSTITIASDAIGSPNTIAATGTGNPAVGPGQLTIPATVVFGSQTVGTTSSPSNLAVTNTGGASVTIQSIVSSAPTEFPVTSSGCTTLAAGASCTISMSFAPAATGARAATITVTSNGVGSPQAINASGTGTAASARGQLSMPGSLTFGAQPAGVPSSPILAVLTNVGGNPVNVTSIVSSAPSEFAVTGNCPTINAGAQCLLNVTFTPAAVGARVATITVTSNGVGSPQTISVTGTGTQGTPQGQLSIQASLDFGSVQVGTTTPVALIAVTNIGAAEVQISGYGSDNPQEFTIAQANCNTLAPNASCTIGVTFKPAASGARSGTITITSNGIGSPQLVAATGTGTATPPPPPPTVDLIEFHHQEWDHYFVTGIADEIAKLDAGVFAGWARTGLTFKSYPLSTAGSVNVCRFFSTSFAPRSSHFYTPFANECAIVKTNPDWQLEGEVFGIPIPDLAGVCPAGTMPVYRLYNNGQGAAPNHRYTTSLSVRAQMIASGWIPEGSGDLGIIMCAPI